MKKVIYIFTLGVLFTNCKTQSNIVTSKEIAKEKGLYTYNEKSVVTTKDADKKVTEKTIENSAPTTANNSTISNEPINIQIVETAVNNIGVKYKNGGITSEGMDCSGLVYSTYRKYKKNLPRSTEQMAKQGTLVSKENAKPGDLIFFKKSGRGTINHVGIITEIVANEVKFIHSSTSKGVIISSTKESYYDSTFAQINRIID